MDDVFWASVVKRWSDASESVIKLKKEIAILREERALHQCSATTSTQCRSHLEHLSASTVPSNPTIETSSDRRDNATSSSSTIRDELQDAENGLRKAKDEYRKLQSDLVASSKIINELKSENQKLVHDHNLEIARIRAEYQRTITPQRLRKLDHLTTFTELQDGMQQQPRSSTATSTAQFVPDIDQQITALKQSLRICEVDKDETRHQLIITQEKLHKAEETIKVLLTSIVKLQTIARHPQAYSSSMRHISDASLHSASRKSSKLSLASNLHSPKHVATSDHTPEISPPKPAESSHTPSHFHENPVKERHSVMKSALPSKRRKTISELPTETTTATIKESDNKFDRAFLKYILGEGVQSLIEHFSNTNDMAVGKRSIATSYLCPTLDHHPWAPSTPGQHGFLFVGFGKEKDSYASPTTRNLFIGLPKTHKTRRIFRYLGKYRVTQAEPLTYDEWITLSDEIQDMYDDQSLETGNDPRPVDNFSLDHDGKRPRISCVQLQCIGFDQQLYETLISYRASEPKWALVHSDALMH